jgi:hypothetical protein
VHGADLVLAALNRELVRPADGLFCFGGEVVEWRHTHQERKQDYLMLGEMLEVHWFTSYYFLYLLAISNNACAMRVASR